jgi:hypothetical protein
VVIEFSPSIDFTGTFTGTAFLWSHHLAAKQQVTIGAGGGTRIRFGAFKKEPTGAGFVSSQRIPQTAPGSDVRRDARRGLDVGRNLTGMTPPGGGGKKPSRI